MTSNGEAIAEGEFQVQLLENGIIIGEMKVLHDSNLGFQLEKVQKEMIPLVLTGKAEGWDQPIRAEDCRISEITRIDVGSQPTVSCKFRARTVLVNPENVTYVPTRTLSLRFGIINVHQQYGVDVETDLGVLTFRNFTDIEEKVQIMQTFEIPMITSHVSILHAPNGTDNIFQIIEKANRVVQNFLKITSLADTTWHEWICLRIFEAINDGSDKAISRFIKIRSVKAKNPRSRGLTNPSHSITFVTNGWKGYEPNIDEKYGFDLALEWYIDSYNNASTIEGMFIHATTCLEMLMDKFHSQNNSEFILDEPTFNEFNAYMKKHASEWLKSRGIGSQLRSALYNNLRGIRRRSYVDKAEMLVKEFGISYEDTGVTFNDIVDVRNSITHRGKYASKDAATAQQDFDVVVKTYEGLFCILSRLFLAMIDYSGIYWDSNRQDWIKFADVCKKPDKSKAN